LFVQIKMYFLYKLFMTRSEENYIKTIFHLAGKGQREMWPPIAIAELMETKPSSVTDYD